MHAAKRLLFDIPRKLHSKCTRCTVSSLLCWVCVATHHTQLACKAVMCLYHKMLTLPVVRVLLLTRPGWPTPHSVYLAQHGSIYKYIQVYL